MEWKKPPRIIARARHTLPLKNLYKRLLPKRDPAIQPPNLKLKFYIEVAGEFSVVSGDLRSEDKISSHLRRPRSL